MIYNVFYVPSEWYETSTETDTDDDISVDCSSRLSLSIATHSPAAF